LLTGEELDKELKEFVKYDLEAELRQRDSG
jgi:hypothetical protein